MIPNKSSYSARYILRSARIAHFPKCPKSVWDRGGDDQGWPQPRKQLYKCGEDRRQQLFPVSHDEHAYYRMVPTLQHSPHTPRLLLTLASVASQYVPNFTLLPTDHANAAPLVRRDSGGHNTEFVVFACLIPILVLLSGVFAGLTLGYMSLDETQLNVLSISGSP
jgi:hypothetical protein